MKKQSKPLAKSSSTERSQNEELNQALIAEKKSSQRYTELFEFAPIAYFVIDSNGTISHLNLRGASLLGIERANLIGKNFLNYVTVEHHELFKSCLENVFELDGKHNCELALRVDERTIWLNVEANIGVTGTDCLVTMVDITENKHSKEALQENESRFRLMFEKSADALLVLDPSSNEFIYLNPSAMELLGFNDLSKVLALDIFKLSSTLQPDGHDSVSKAKEMIALAMQNGSHRFEWMHRSRYCEDFPAEVLLTPVKIGEKQLIMITWRDITERKQNEKIITKTFEQLKTAEKLAHIGSWEWDIEKDKFTMSDEWLQIYGVKNNVLNISELIDISHPDDIKVIEKKFKNALDGGRPYDITHRIIRQDNAEVRIIHAKGIVRFDENGKANSMIGTAQDITNSKLAEEKLKLAASVFTNAREGIVITDVTGSIIDVNKTFVETTGYSHKELIGQNPSILKSGLQASEFYTDMWQTIIEKGYWSGELWNRRNNGEVYAEMKTISAVHDEHGVTTHYVALGNDISLKIKRQNQLERIAHYDILTNLPNRSLLADRLSQAMLQCSRHKQSLAVVFLDLDDFKEVNDIHGHSVGDELLIALSLRMKEALREGDTLARIGGDEYVAVLADLAKVEDCEPALERLLLAASEPITIDNVVLNVSASIGVTFYPQDSVDADQLMRHADQAMYVAKESGKNRYHFFDTAQDEAVKTQRESLDAIRRALDEQQFVLYYQPKVNMRTGTVIGVEALIRWQHPERGLLNPIEFLPVIENHTMSIEMGEWVIGTALKQISQWQITGLNLPVSTSVNIAAVQLQQHDFIERLTALLAAHPDVEPRYLELEVLETSAIENVKHVSKIMGACMALGVNFALDDFGTGYSSLTYLRRLPASLIKIDRSFVRDMLHDPDDFVIVEGVIALAKSFKRDVIAEGVETIAHGTALLQMGCELAQGYGIAKPMPACDIPAWISGWKPDVSWQI